MSMSLAVAAKHAPAASIPPLAGSTAYAPEFDLPGTVQRIAADREVYAEGDEARCFYKVISGVVRTCRLLSDGRRQIDSFYQAGDVFGLEAGAEHPLTAEAVTDCTVVACRRRGLEAVMIQNDRLSQWFFTHAVTSMARTREHSLLLGRGSAARKIAAFLLEMAEQGDSDSIVDLPMGRQDIADYLGLTIETVSRTLSQMEKDGTIALPSARRVMLKRRVALRDLNG